MKQSAEMALTHTENEGREPGKVNLERRGWRETKAKATVGIPRTSYSSMLV